MKKLLLGELDMSLLPRVKEDLITLNQRRLRILIGALFVIQILRETASLFFPGGLVSITGAPFSFSDILELAVLAVFFLLLTFFAKSKMIKYLYFHLFLSFWILSILFGLFGVFGEAPPAANYTAVLTVFMNVMLINLFFHLHPVVAALINTLVFAALLIFLSRTDTLSGFLLFSTITTYILLFFVDVTLFRTTFFQVYYRRKNLRQIEFIQEQNIELEAQNEEIQAQQASLEEYAQRMEALFANIPGVVYRSENDGQWTMIFLSQRIEELTGYMSRDFQSKKMNFKDIVFPEDLDRVMETINAQAEKGESFNVEYRIITKTGKTKWVREYGQGVSVKGGRAEWIDGVIIDITEEKRIARLRDDVERTVRHDLKNPLSGIIGFTTLLEDAENLGEEEKEYIALIRQSGYKILHMINNSLDLFKMEEGNYRFFPEECDLISILNTVIMEQSEKLPMKQLAILLTLNGKEINEKSVLPIKGEPYNLESLFSNLLSNAIDASPAGKTITLSITEGDPVHIEMHNHGAVPEEIRGTFFSRYATSGKKQGTGLGTYSARLIARTHGGDITFTTSESAGTSLFVTLPAYATLLH